MSNIYELVSLIRDRINNPIKQSRLIESDERWNRLCSSLDVVEDMQSAIEYYFTMKFPEETGGKYLFLYGLLQAFFLQQDAVSNMYKALYGEGINFKQDYKALFKIRQLRNDVVGHPTNRNKGKSFHFISQPTITKENFQIMTSYRNGIDRFSSINVIDSINTQEEEIISILKKTINRLDSDIKEFKEKYKMKKLHEYFERGIEYVFQKLYGMTYESDKESPMAGVSLKIITELVNNVRNKLIERYGSLRSLSGIESCYEEIDFLVDYITKFYRGKIRCEKMLIRFLIECLRKRIDDLADMCKKIDVEMQE